MSGWPNLGNYIRQKYIWVNFLSCPYIVCVVSIKPLLTKKTLSVSFEIW